MTQKEKAKELVYKMKAQQKPSLRVSAMEININDTMQNAKQCALIAVDEIIEGLEVNQWQNRNVIEYYTEVKDEIEKL